VEKDETIKHKGKIKKRNLPGRNRIELKKKKVAAKEKGSRNEGMRRRLRREK
jgi:hypothetical protein